MAALDLGPGARRGPLHGRSRGAVDGARPARPRRAASCWPRPAPASSTADRQSPAASRCTPPWPMIELGYERYMAEHIRDTFFTPEFAADQPRVACAGSSTRSGQAAHRCEPTCATSSRARSTRPPTGSRQIERPSLVLIGDRDRHMGGTGVHWEQSRVPARARPGRAAGGHRRRLARLLLAGAGSERARSCGLGRGPHHLTGLSRGHRVSRGRRPRRPPGSDASG